MWGREPWGDRKGFEINPALNPKRWKNIRQPMYLSWTTIGSLVWRFPNSSSGPSGSTMISAVHVRQANMNLTCPSCSPHRTRCTVPQAVQATSVWSGAM